MPIEQGFLGQPMRGIDFAGLRSNLDKQQQAQAEREARIERLKGLSLLQKGESTPESLLGTAMNFGRQAMWGAEMARDIADPGVRPFVKDPSLLNSGLLVLGAGPGLGKGLSEIIRKARAAGVDDMIRNAGNKFKFWDKAEIRQAHSTPGHPMYGQTDQKQYMQITDLDPDVRAEVQKKAAAGDQDALDLLEDVQRRTRPYGGIAYDTVGGVTKVHSTGIHKALRNQDVGMHMYMNLLSDAMKKGHTMFTSDMQVSNAAATIWESLARRGFNVKVNMGSSHAPVGGYASNTDNPVFRIDLEKPYDKGAYDRVKKDLAILRKEGEKRRTPQYLMESPLG